MEKQIKCTRCRHRLENETCDNKASEFFEINFGDEDIKEILDFNNCNHFFSEIDSENTNTNYDANGLFISNMFDDTIQQ